MFRIIPHGHAAWMSGDAGQGWAHYFGSRVTDLVYAQCGTALWPDPYDYRADGMNRLTNQLAQAASAAIPENQAASQWKALVDIVGDKGVAPLFRAWSKSDVDHAAPSPAICQALAGQAEAARLLPWWTNAAPKLLAKP